NATFNSITFSGSGYALSGQALTLGTTSVSGSGNVASNGSAGTSNSIALDMVLGAPAGSIQFFTMNSGTALTVAGRLSGTTGSLLAKEGTGTLTLSGDNS